MNDQKTHQGPLDWLAGGGEMAAFIKAKDWSKTPLGPIESWPQSLRTVVSLVQASSSPINLDRVDRATLAVAPARPRK